MKKDITRRKAAILLPAALLLAVAVVSARRAQVGALPAELLLVPFVPAEVRILRPAEVAMLVYNPAENGEVYELESFQVRSGGDIVFASELVGELVGDARYGEVNALIERLPHEISELHRDRRYFADENAPEFGGSEVIEARHEIASRWNALREAYDRGMPQPFTQIDFPLAYDQLFFAGAEEGETARIELRLSYRTPSGQLKVATTTRLITRIAPFALPSASLEASFGGTVNVHAGDLHVHSCHGEASGACAPSSNCTAETLQLSGSFSYGDLKTQYQALGYDWFTATDHSYCINSTSEFAAIQAECAAATDGSFLVMADIELSSDESGPQTGSDLGDVLCLGTTSANHMGAHGISARIPGGEDGLLGFCDGLFSNVLDPFGQNIAAIRGQGGYPIVHHPLGSSFGWNSYAQAQGIEANALHGVEIWGGASQSGQAGAVGRWVDWLLDGRLLYAYSGSDTHDAAFAFGANHALLVNEPFTIPNIDRALQEGRSYISNAHSLVIEVGLGGSAVPMGSMFPVPHSSPPAALAPRVHYNFGGDTAEITIFSGRVGDAAETVLCSSGPVTGSGIFECIDTLNTSSNTWYRAYSEGGAKVAYTNPVFFLPVTTDPANYCIGKVTSQGCTPASVWQGSASTTSPASFTVGAENVVSHQNGIMFYGYAPAYTPFQDGTLCAAPMLHRTAVQNSGGDPGPNCTGSFSVDFNARIQSGVDPLLQPGVRIYAQHWFRDPAAASSSGLSDALQFSIGP
jgi:hypothetical protein